MMRPLKYKTHQLTLYQTDVFYDCFYDMSILPQNIVDEINIDEDTIYYQNFKGVICSRIFTVHNNKPTYHGIITTDFINIFIDEIYKILKIEIGEIEISKRLNEAIGATVKSAADNAWIVNKLLSPSYRTETVRYLNI